MGRGLGGVGRGRDSSGALRVSRGWVGHSGSWEGGGGGPSDGAGGGSNAGTDADRTSEGASGCWGAGSALRPARRSVSRRKRDCLPEPGSPDGDEAAVTAGRAEPGPAGAEGRPAAGPPAGGRAPGPVGSEVDRGGAGGLAPVRSVADGVPPAGPGCWPRPAASGALGSGASGIDGSGDRRGSGPRWRSNRERVGAGVGWPPGGAAGPSLGKVESLAEIEPLCTSDSLAPGAVPGTPPAVAGPGGGAGSPGPAPGPAVAPPGP